MNEGRIASRYARALLRVHAQAGTAETLYREAQQLCLLYRQSAHEITRVLTSGVIPASRRAQFLLHIVERVSPSLRDFTRLMIARRRELYLYRALLVFLEMYRAHAGVVWAEVTSAAPLTTAQQRAVERLVGARFCGRIELSLRVDPELIGGFTVHVPGYMYDRSVRSELRRIREEIS